MEGIKEEELLTDRLKQLLGQATDEGAVSEPEDDEEEEEDGDYNVDNDVESISASSSAGSIHSLYDDDDDDTCDEGEAAVEDTNIKTATMFLKTKHVEPEETKPVKSKMVIRQAPKSIVTSPICESSIRALTKGKKIDIYTTKNRRTPRYKGAEIFSMPTPKDTLFYFGDNPKTRVDPSQYVLSLLPDLF